MTYEELKKAYEAMAEKCSALEKKLEDKDTEIEHLTELLIKRNKMLFGTKSERSKYLDIEGQLTLDGDILINEAENLSDLSLEEITEEEIQDKNKKHPHRGRTLHKNLPRKNIVYTLPDSQCKCPVCAGKMKELAPEHLTSRLAVIPGKVYMVDYARMQYSCPNCEKKGEKSVIISAENKTPATVIPKGLPDHSVIADIIQRKYQLGMPLYRQEKYWEAQGIYLNRTSMANWIIKSSEWFVPFIDFLKEEAFKEDVFCADETPLQVLNIEGKKNTKKCQMWVGATGYKSSRKIYLYWFKSSRSKATAEELFAGYEGVLQTDGYVAYGSGKYEHAGCWAHVRRKFVDSFDSKAKKAKAAFAVQLIDKAFDLEKNARENNFSDEQILNMRQTEIKPIIDDFYEYIGSLKTGKSGHLYEAITYAQNQKTKLLVFLKNPHVEMSNNLAERTCKSFVINRKNFLFSDTDKGADATAVFMSVIETAKRNNLDVYGYLLYLLNRLASFGKEPTRSQLASLAPWSISLPKYCKATYDEIIQK